MIIETSRNEREWIVALSGRLDRTTSPALEKTIT